MGAIKTIYYVGPSLYGCRPAPIKGELWRAPAKFGDILSDVLRLRPKQICLIDGQWRQALSVQHKEIVFALLQGVICVGAASVGALRAAELSRYGMIGIGKIYEMYAQGEEDDSLVAMTYDPESFKPLDGAKIGQELKVADALAAVDFMRSAQGKKPDTTLLSADAISPFFEMCIMRALEQN